MIDVSAGRDVVKVFFLSTVDCRAIDIRFLRDVVAHCSSKALTSLDISPGIGV